MKSFALFWIFYGIWTYILSYSGAEELIPFDKRYVAALAKNGRLPKFNYAQKKSQESEELPSREDTRQTLMQMEDPSNTYEDGSLSPTSFFESSENPYFESSFPYSKYDDVFSSLDVRKRNVAALARLGRLNTIRYGRFQPHFVSGKRVSIEDDNEEIDQKNDDNEIDRSDVECQTYNEDDDDETTLDMNGKQKKRYVAALARSGRLPIWHSQRMWSGGKRDYSNSALNDDSRIDLDNDLENTVNKMLVFSPKQKRCKKGSENKRQKRSLEEMSENENMTDELSRGNFQEEKRNVASLARNGKLPLRRYQDEKRDEYQNQNTKFSENYGEEGQNIATLVRNENLPEIRSGENKRNLAALARNGKLPAFRYVDDKRNIAALARNGKLPAFNSGEDKRNLAALARNGKLQSFRSAENKRNIAALARNGKLPAFNSGDDKRNLASLARNGKLPSYRYVGDKRNIAALARNGKLPAFSSGEDKRNMAELEEAKYSGNGDLMTYDSGEEKRNMAALARNGKLPSFYYEAGKRNLAALARNGKLPSFNNRAEKRNIAALARNGKLPSYNSMETKRKTDFVPATYDLDGKRNIASMARNGKLLPNSYLERKRNIASLARNGKLLVNNQRYKHSITSSNPNDMWQDMILQEDEV